MLTRRFALGLTASALLGSATSVRAQSAAPSQDDAKAIANLITEWSDDPANIPFFDVPVGDDVRGSLRLPNDHPAVKKAAEVLASVKKTGRPIDVALDLMARIPPDLRMEWPRDRPDNPQPANPMIVAFFAATRTDPAQGDQTAWCAAFMCWILQRAGVPHPRNAGSRAFRSWFDKTDTPEKGDLVVFRNKRDPIYGHVGFFDGFNADGSKVGVIGGNQGDALKRAEFPINGSTLVLHSYRTTARLRQAG